MSVLGHERWLLREAYMRADQALEMLSSELAKDEQHWIADTSKLMASNPEDRHIAIGEITHHLATKPIGIFENPGVTRALAQALYTLHATGQLLSDLNHEAELTIQEVRNISIQASPEAIRSRDDRGQSGGRPVPVPDDIPRKRDGHHRRHLDSPDQNQGGY